MTAQDISPLPLAERGPFQRRRVIRGSAPLGPGSGKKGRGSASFEPSSRLSVALRRANCSRKVQGFTEPFGLNFALKGEG